MLFEPILPPAEREKLAVRSPPTREEIAQAPTGLFVPCPLEGGWVELLVALDSMPSFCPCEFVSENNRARCLRTLWMFRPPRQPRARARRRQRHGGSRCERSPPGDDEGGGGEPPGPPRSGGMLLAGGASS
jgi:hypothetical protein